MKAHFVGVSGTGMGALATLFREAGHDVSGSDASFDPPIGPALQAAGVRCLEGYSASHVSDTKPDLVVVGNAIRKENPEALEAIVLDVPRASMSSALRTHFLEGRRPFVVCGTHGKTTTSSMAAWLLEKAGTEPGFFIGGVPKNFGKGAKIGNAKRKLGSSGAVKALRSPFVVEGDEYDAVYWHKEPKFLDYVGVGQDDVVILTSIEHDHIDIYPNEAGYVAEFDRMVARIPEGGLLVIDARDPKVRAVAAKAKCRVVHCALDGDDTGPEPPTWLAAPVPIDSEGVQSFDVFVGGSSAGRFAMKSPGSHNVRNALCVLAACAEGFGIGFADLRAGLGSFEGVKRRQDLVAKARGVRVYDDFAHHPTAVHETLRALRQKHPAGKLFAVFEPRSATACRALHQADYPGSFASADRVILAPLGRMNVPEAERLDVVKLVSEIGSGAENAPSVDAIVETLAREATEGDTIALLSNGAFGGIHQKLIAALSRRDAVGEHQVHGARKESK
jgi:UDP-N-acetylmuramate: L-alanyl-gamma-D-glutamyl-meso-diaminopimelate ligase